MFRPRPKRYGLNARRLPLLQLLDEPAEQVLRYLLIVVELHGERTYALRLRTQVRGVP